MRAKYNEATVVEDSSGAAAEQTYDALRALFQYLPPGDTVDSFSITIDVTMKPVVVRKTAPAERAILTDLIAELRACPVLPTTREDLEPLRNMADRAEARLREAMRNDE